jgi:uncharacterized membrane protein
MALIPILTEWLHFAVRWLHVIAGIAWIGSSFYFVHLDLSLKPRRGLPKGAYGEAWQVHGGGFYHMVKFLVAPPEMPEKLTWFKWEAYTTWLSGMAMLILVYYMNADLYLIDKSTMDLTPAKAVLLSAIGLTLGWLIYDALCRSRLGRSDVALGLTGFVFLIALSYGFNQIFSGRGAFMQMGALIGTMMVANVFVIIMPNQRKVVAALLRGDTPDPSLGAQAKQRSLHNNYLTLPVVFIMIGNHYPLAFATRYSWIILALVIIMGTVIRVYFNTMHKGIKPPLWPWLVAAQCLLLIIALSTFGPAAPTAQSLHSPAAGPVDIADVNNIVSSRCSMCHAEQPVWEGVDAAPKGVMLDTPERIALHINQIGLQAGLTRAMPPGNLTEITDEERQTLANWVISGAKPD